MIASVLSHQPWDVTGPGWNDYGKKLWATLETHHVDCGKNIIRRSQVRIIFQLFLSIIEERNLACPDSQDIIICDKQLEQLVGMPHLHLTQLREKIMSMLTLTDMGRSVLNPTDTYKSIINRIFPQQLRLIRPVLPVSPQRVKWIMEENLSILLIGFASPQPLEFDYILSLVTGYISANRNRLLHPQNLEIACIRNDPLFNIFGTSFFHKSQLRGLVRDHVSPTVVE